MKNKKFLMCLILGLFSLCATKVIFSQTNFWMQTKGPEDGDIRALAVDPEGRIFAGSNGGGIFRSIDNGNTWSEANNGFHPNIRHVHVWSFAIKSSDCIFAGVYGHHDGGVFRSTDHGETWIKVGRPETGLTNYSVLCLAINPQNGHIFAGTEWGGIFRSTDNGNTWVEVNTGLSKKFIGSIAINSNGVIIAGAGNLYENLSWSLFCSIDNGNTWTEVCTGPEYTWVRVGASPTGHFFAAIFRVGFLYSVNGLNWVFVNPPPNMEVTSITFNSLGHIFVGTGTGVFCSTDNGMSWNSKNNGLPQAWGAQLWGVPALGISPNGTLFAGTIFGGGIFRSTDNGENWIRLNKGLRNTWVAFLAINSSGDIFAGTTHSGIFRTTDSGESWIAVNNGLTFHVVRSLIINPTNDYIFAATYDGIYCSINNGESWFQTSFSGGHVWSLSINSNGHIFAGT